MKGEDFLNYTNGFDPNTLGLDLSFFPMVFTAIRYTREEMTEELSAHGLTIDTPLASASIGEAAHNNGPYAVVSIGGMGITEPESAAYVRLLLSPESAAWIVSSIQNTMERLGCGTRFQAMIDQNLPKARKIDVFGDEDDNGD